MRRFTTVSLALSILLLASNLTAQQTTTTSVPNLIRYSGTLKEAQTTGAVPSAPLGVTFAIYKQQEGGAPVWQETQNVTPDASGQYTVLLGNTTGRGLPGDLFSQQEERWLGVQVQGQAEQPRSLLVSVPYAFKAGEADTLGGLPASAFVKAPLSDWSGSASQNTGTAGNPASTTKSGVGIDTVVNCASAKTNYIPVFTSAAPPNITICNSVMYQASNNIGIGTTTPAAKLDVNGSVNTAATYGIGGSTVVTIASQPDANLFLGVGAGVSDVAGQGKFNTFSGYQAGFSNTTGPANTFFGLQAGYSNTTGQRNTILGADAGFSSTGSDNTFVGFLAGLNNTANGATFLGSGAGISNTSGSSNTFLGFEAGYSNTTGTPDVFVGWQAGYSNTTGQENVFVGTSAGYSNTSCCNAFVGDEAGYNNTAGTYNAFFGRDAGLDNIDGSFDTFLGHWAGVGNTHGNENTFVGNLSGYSNTSGSNNLFLGFYAGYYNVTGASDIYIGSQAGLGFGTESNTIRIGEQGTGIGQQNAAYVAGVYGSFVDSNGAYMLVDDTGKLGTGVSSRRFKEQIADMGDSSAGLLKLRPVTFLYKPEYDKGPRKLQYGLIAEEVADVYPEMVAYDKDGQPYTVKYQLLAPMLLNEVQKQYRRSAAQAEVIKAQEQEIASLKRQLQLQNAGLQERLSRLEKMVGTQVQTVAQK